MRVVINTAVYNVRDPHFPVDHKFLLAQTDLDSDICAEMTKALFRHLSPNQQVMN